MKDLFTALPVFALLLAPFAFFLAAIRFVPQDVRQRMFKCPALERFNNKPAEALGNAVYFFIMFAIGGGFPDFRQPWYYVVGAMIFGFFLGQTSIYWEMSRSKSEYGHKNEP
jgi:hypothetical protein